MCLYQAGSGATYVFFQVGSSLRNENQQIFWTQKLSSLKTVINGPHRADDCMAAQEAGAHPCLRRILVERPLMAHARVPEEVMIGDIDAVEVLGHEAMEVE